MTKQSLPKVETKELARMIDEATGKHHPDGNLNGCPTCLALLGVRSDEMNRMAVRGKRYARKHATATGLKIAKMMIGLL